MPRICVVITARPSYSRIRSALIALRDHPGVTLQLVLAASALSPRFGQVERVIADDGFVVAARLQTLLDGADGVSMVRTAALTQIDLASAFDRLRPDLVVTIADRFETLATATAAAFMHLPLAHIQGGESSGNIDDKVRHAVTQLADYHFVATPAARARVIAAGVAAERVVVTGCPSIDLAADLVATEPGPPGSGAPAVDPWQLCGLPRPAAWATDSPTPTADYLLLLQHPVTDEAAAAGHQIAETLAALRDQPYPVFVFASNPDGGADAIADGLDAVSGASDATLYRVGNLAPLAFLRLLRGAAVLLGNSSVGIREASFLGVPVVNIGSRQTRRERGPNVIDVPPVRAAIADALASQLAHGPWPGVDLYGDGRSGARLAEALVDVARRTGDR